MFIPTKDPGRDLHCADEGRQIDVLVLACDMRIKPDLLRFIWTSILWCRASGYPQGLHAIYKKTCLVPIAEHLKQNRLKIIRFYDRIVSAT